jgi:hypothetical protein
MRPALRVTPYALVYALIALAASPTGLARAQLPVRVFVGGSEFYDAVGGSHNMFGSRADGRYVRGSPAGFSSSYAGPDASGPVTKPENATPFHD